MRISKAIATAVIFSSATILLGVGGPKCCQVVPPDMPGYVELSARWWQWVSEIPGYENPLFDTTGEFAAVGQPDDVWFLAGTMGGDPVVRKVTVRERPGQAIAQAVAWMARGAGQGATARVTGQRFRRLAVGDRGIRRSRGSGGICRAGIGELDRHRTRHSAGEK